MTNEIPRWQDEVGKAEGQLVDVVERKVKAAATASFLSGLGVSALGLYVFHGEVPDWATAIIGSAVTGILTGAAGWLTKHTHRAPVVPPAPPTT